MSIQKTSKFVSLLENITLIVIFLAVVQTITEDLLTFLNFNPLIIKYVTLSSFFFDLYFSAEFIVRIVSASSRKKGSDYFLYRNGWIDALSSFPLLFFVSGPFLVTTMFSSSIVRIGLLNKLGLLKMIKAIRVTRILRFLRILKVFGKIKNVNSEMAQRHIQTVSTIAVFSVITVIFTLSIFKDVFTFIPSNSFSFEQKETAFNATLDVLLKNKTDAEIVNILNGLDKKDSGIIYIRLRGNDIYLDNRFTLTGIEYKLQMHDHLYSRATGLGGINLIIVYYRESLSRINAWDGIANFVIIMFILISVVIFYTKNLALTVTDPIYVMRLGFEKKDYTLAVKIPEPYKDEDIFKLADDYNNRWLPAKLRKLEETKNTDKKSLLDINNLL